MGNREYLADRGIATGVHYPIALPFLEAYTRMGHGHEDFPNAFTVQNHALSLPIFPELGEERTLLVARAVTDFYASRSGNA